MADIATTHGWDTVFAIRLPDANAAIVRQQTSPPGFTAAGAPAYRLDKFTTLSGTFGAWQLARGPSGSLVHVSVPITSGTMTGLEGTWDLTGATAVLSLRLAALAGTATQTGTPYSLQVLATGLPTTPGANPEPPASLVSLTYSSANPVDDDGDALLRLALVKWAIANLADFEHIFATITLNQFEDQAEWAFLAPTYVGYAFSSAKTDADSFLGILCQTEGRSPDGLICEVSPFAIPPGQRAAFLLGPHLIMEHLLYPRLPDAFTGAKAGDFTLATDHLSVTLAHAIALPATVHEGSTYHPQLEAFTLALAGDRLRLDSGTSVPLGTGVVGHLQSSHFATVRLVTRTDGTQSLAFDDSLPPIVGKPWTTVTNAAVAMQIFLAILGIIAVAILGTLTSGFAFVI